VVLKKQRRSSGGDGGSTHNDASLKAVQASDVKAAVAQLAAALLNKATDTSSIRSLITPPSNMQHG